MLHQAHGAAACNNKKIDDDEAAAAEQRKLELLCASQLNDTLEGTEEEWGSSFRYSLPPHPFCWTELAACLGGARIF